MAKLTFGPFNSAIGYANPKSYQVYLSFSYYVSGTDVIIDGWDYAQSPQQNANAPWKAPSWPYILSSLKMTFRTPSNYIELISGAGLPSGDAEGLSNVTRQGTNPITNVVYTDLENLPFPIVLSFPDGVFDLQFGFGNTRGSLPQGGNPEPYRILPFSGGDLPVLAIDFLPGFLHNGVEWVPIEPNGNICLNDGGGWVWQLLKNRAKTQTGHIKIFNGSQWVIAESPAY